MAGGRFWREPTVCSSHKLVIVLEIHVSLIGLSLPPAAGEGDHRQATLVYRQRGHLPGHPAD